MIIQIIGLDGRILALLTSKRFFSTVCELVCFHILNFSAGVVALVTPERLFPRMGEQVSLEVRSCCEGVGALVYERLLSTVNQDVFL